MKNNVWTLIFASRIVFDLHLPRLHVFSVMRSCTGPRVLHLTVARSFFKTGQASIPIPSIFTFGICIFAHFTHMFMLCLSTYFLFFSSIQKIITHWLLVQMEWGFLHNDPYHVYNFMNIFPWFVHCWIFIVARDCVCVCIVDRSCHILHEMMRFIQNSWNFVCLK